MKNAEYWIQKLKLTNHPEGGYFQECYRSSVIITKNELPDSFTGPRSIATSIYFLLDLHNISHFHRIKSDELWHFYCGSSLTIHVIEPGGNYYPILLGADPEKEESLFAVVKAHSWFAAEVNNKSSYSLVGCTVSPGFDFADFEMGHSDTLLESHPEHKSIIQQFSVR